ncbi:hypothetical protein NEOLI_002076 [Neolecta irregularis DAH-3]|uniref:Uncharacterized protein n=1 Tax=Neolecta irregularis (strain DAH-3) TaxID=1198029 RepID=A0A1U7LSF8_NEOID|nr:hypothetical protein NEOLI_002076 [Neolecta irregularis DAH-3]|eukprot:OLL25597.1 hypothetical protein NEOLI_002076 [Neolecta irregularis DAH-3]
MRARDQVELKSSTNELKSPEPADISRTKNTGKRKIAVGLEGLIVKKRKATSQKEADNTESPLQNSDVKTPSSGLSALLGIYSDDDLD